MFDRFFKKISKPEPVYGPPLSKEDILKKAERKSEEMAYQRKCIKAKVCPICGDDLVDMGADYHDIEMGCRRCNKIWD